MNKQSQAKSRATKLANEKKIMTICGYEIWRDPLNYTTIKNGKNLYFTSLRNALIDIRDELIRNKLAGVETLEKAIYEINRSDERFIDALFTALAGVGRTE